MTHPDIDPGSMQSPRAFMAAAAAVLLVGSVASCSASANPPTETAPPSVTQSFEPTPTSPTPSTPASSSPETVITPAVPSLGSSLPSVEIVPILPSGSEASSAPATSTAPKAPTGPSLPAGTSKYDKLARTFIVGFDAATYSEPQIAAVVRATHIGGVFLTDTHNGGPIYKALHKEFGNKLLLCSDEEGGEVQRLSYPFTFPSAKEMGQMTTTQVEAIGEKVGATMLANGVTMDLAPVLDLDNGKNNGAISGLDRSFGGTPANIAAKAGAFMKGLRAKGVTAVLKHFPGLGYATPDSNTDDRKAYSPPFSQIQTRDLLPYETILHAASPTDIPSPIMLSNEYVTGLDSTRPASISSKVVSYVRQQGYTGVITTDALSAIGYDGKTLAQNVLAAEQAGVTAPLFSYGGSVSGTESIIRSVATTLPDSRINDSVSKVLTLEGYAS